MEMEVSTKEAKYQDNTLLWAVNMLWPVFLCSAPQLCKNLGCKHTSSTASEPNCNEELSEWQNQHGFHPKPATFHTHKISARLGWQTGSLGSNESEMVSLDSETYTSTCSCNKTGLGNGNCLSNTTWDWMESPSQLRLIRGSVHVLNTLPQGQLS